MQNIVIFGATSAIAQAVAKIYAKRGDRLYLIARNEEKVALLAQDLLVRGASSCETATVDLQRTQAHQALIATAKKNLGTIDVALIAHGTLPDQKAIQDSYEQSLNAIETNGLSVISLMQALSVSMLQNRCGTIAVISSVAGDRGRQSNYIYGTAKSMVTTFAQGLRNRLEKYGIHVLTIKPGFVDTPMTAAIEKGLLFAQPQDVAANIVRAIDKQKNVIYTPFFWRYILLITQHIPEFIFKKLSL